MKDGEIMNKILFLLNSITFVSLIFFSNLSNSILNPLYSLRFISIVFFFLISLLIILLKKKIVINLNYKSIIWMIFSLCMLYSAVVNRGDINSEIYSLCMASSLVIFIIPSLYDNSTFISLTMNSVLISSLMIVIISVIKVTINIPYSGIYNNPNVLGLNMMLPLIVMCCKIRENILKNKFKWSHLLMISIFFMFILMCTSRTILFTSLLIIFITLLKTPIRIKNLKAILSSLSIIFIIAIINHHQILVYIQGIIDKFGDHTYNDITRGRSAIWRYITDNFNVWGHGNSFVSDAFGLSAHNSYMEILSKYGIVVLIILVTLSIIFLYNSWKTLKINDNTINLFTLLLNVSFISISMFESIFSPIGISLSTLWILVNLSKRRVNKHENNNNSSLVQ